MLQLLVFQEIPPGIGVISLLNSYFINKEFQSWFFHIFKYNVEWEGHYMTHSGVGQYMCIACN